jgi:hypothetical protein
MYTSAKWNLHSAAMYVWQRRAFEAHRGSWMTPKYSAQWWEKVTARAQPISAEHDAAPTTGSIAPIDKPEIQKNETIQASKALDGRGLGQVSCARCVRVPPTSAPVSTERM